MTECHGFWVCRQQVLGNGGDSRSLTLPSAALCNEGDFSRSEPRLPSEKLRALLPKQVGSLCLLRDQRSSRGVSACFV